jgi:hypothetical protein
LKAARELKRRELTSTGAAAPAFGGATQRSGE